MEGTKQFHFVLVHGACHGAWCWYKLKPLLESIGHHVSALDLAASGIDHRIMHQVQTKEKYAQPLLELMATIPVEDKVVLVGHSMGGVSIGLAMEMFPEKIRVAVFLAAFMPDTVHRPSYPLEKFFERAPEEGWLDTQFIPCGTPEEPQTSLLPGPNYVVSKLYHLCPPQDVTLAKTLLRPSFTFIEDLSKRSAFSAERFGSVKRAFIVCPKDLCITVDFQRWQIETTGADKVKELENADHMAMLSSPQEVYQALLEIANDFA